MKNTFKNKSYGHFSTKRKMFFQVFSRNRNCNEIRFFALNQQFYLVPNLLGKSFSLPRQNINIKLFTCTAVRFTGEKDAIFMYRRAVDRY